MSFVPSLELHQLNRQIYRAYITLHIYENGYGVTFSGFNGKNVIESSIHDRVQLNSVIREFFFHLISLENFRG